MFYVICLYTLDVLNVVVSGLQPPKLFNRSDHFRPGTLWNWCLIVGRPVPSLGDGEFDSRSAAVPFSPPRFRRSMEYSSIAIGSRSCANTVKYHIVRSLITCRLGKCNPSRSFRKYSHRVLPQNSSLSFFLKYKIEG